MNRPPYQRKNFEHLFGTPGFSDRLLKDHFELCEGYVKNTSELNGLLGSFAGKKSGCEKPSFAEAKRRFGWEFTGMRLHEYYFGSMGKDTAPLV